LKRQPQLATATTATATTAATSNRIPSNCNDNCNQQLQCFFLQDDQQHRSLARRQCSVAARLVKRAARSFHASNSGWARRCLETAEKAGVSVNYMPREGNARRRKPPAARLLRL
jgi:hypothetical protein